MPRGRTTRSKPGAFSTEPRAGPPGQLEPRNIETIRRQGTGNHRQSRRHLFEYLASEVLEQLPGELQEFLLRCSLLSELTVARCEQISGNPRAAELLDE